MIGVVNIMIMKQINFVCIIISTFLVYVPYSLVCEQLR